MKKILTFVMLLVSLFTVLFVANTNNVEALGDKTFSLAGTINGWNPADTTYDLKWDSADQRYEVVVTFAVNDEFKVVKNHAWGGDFGWDGWSTDKGKSDYLTDAGNGNFKVAVANTYLVYVYDNANASYGFWAGDLGIEIYSETPVYKAHTIEIKGSFDTWSTGLKLEDGVDENHIYEGQISLTGEQLFKVVVDGSWFGFGGITVEGIDAVDAGGNDHNFKATFDGVYDLSYDFVARKLTFTRVQTTDDFVKQVFEYVYMEGVYTRKTHINLATENNEVKADFYQHFHNAQNGTNVFADRTTKFCGDYLYFVETGVGFGTNGNNLTEFTWVDGEKTNEKVNSTLPGMEEYFVTLLDFQSIKGWEEVDGVYVNKTTEAINAAVAFTAPGWKAPANYLTYTQVTLEVTEDGIFTINLWVSTAADATKLVEGHITSGTNSLFSQAAIILSGE